MNDPTVADLAHIPGPRATPIVGHTLQILREGYTFTENAVAEFGDVYRIRFLNRWRISFATAEAAEYILTDPDKLFSSEQGWDTIASFFTRGLMVRDFDDHRQHRRIMQSAFRKPAMDSYLALIAPAMDQLITEWPADQTMKFYPAIKEMTLRLGANVFMGLDLDDPRTPMLNRAFIEEVNASISPIRTPLPGTPFRRGLKAREWLKKTFADLIAERRDGAGTDFFSEMCRATDEDGRAWTDEEIVDHFNFLMMAAHDTTASGLTCMVWGLAKHPEWQDRVAEEVAALGDGPFNPAMLNEMPVTDRVFKEALRMMPPVPIIPRKTLRDFEWEGIRIPAGTSVNVQQAFIQMSPRHYTDPEKFDPDRFSPNRAEDRSHRFAWAPFGGGAHKCIGMHFSTMQVKIITRALLSRFRVTLADDSPVEWRRLPIPQPKGGLPVILTYR